MQLRSLRVIGDVTGRIWIVL